MTKAPGEHYTIYDAGNFEDKGKTCVEAVHEIVPDGARIDLLILSHGYGDQVASVPQIFEDYDVGIAIRPTIRNGGSATWKAAKSALEKEEKSTGMTDMKIGVKALTPGQEFPLGEASVTTVIGYGTPPKEWGLISDSEKKNAGSVVVRLTYKGQSILFTGDTVGRHLNDPDDACKAAESSMVENADEVPIKSAVLIAPHHGADNGSSNYFIKAVSPKYVIFSAGHKTTYKHPRATTAARYLANGLKPEENVPYGSWR